MKNYKITAFLLALFLSLFLYGNDLTRVDFQNTVNQKKGISSWTYKGKLGTKDSTFRIVKLDGKKVLRLRSEKSTGSILFDISKVNLEKTPVMRWRWRVDLLPEGADGRLDAKDDQAIGIYIGSGGPLSQHTIAFRWETLTPRNATGFVKYGMGTVKVHWKCVRNQKDKTGVWYIDECNLKEALKKIYPDKKPERLALTLSANSQYTGTCSVAYLDYIEFVPAEKKPCSK